MFREGTGQHEITRHVKVGGNTFNAAFLELLRDHLPNLRFAHIPEAVLGPVPFAFDGGEGILMPLRVL